MQKREKTFSYKKCAIVCLLIVAPLLLAFAALAMGRFPLSLQTVFQVLAAKISGAVPIDLQTEKVIWGIRLPRILLAMLVGAGLAVSGLAFQNLFSNPLATPDTLGVASGASFGAVLALLFGLNLLWVQLLALIGGVLAVSLTYSVSANRDRGSITTVVLAGLIIGSLFTALVSLVKYVADAESQLPSIVYWLMGSLSSANYRMLLLGAPLILIGIIVLLLLRWRLNLLPLTEDEARSAGVNISHLRLLTVISATMITASCVSMCGQVGWVGLLVPHMCRMLFGGNNQKLVPACISLGAMLMLIVDTMARTVSAGEIPVSILTAIIGAPVFIVLLRRTGGWSL
ncbi:MAG: iron ABC transporter permease [Firmicutes bacterium]|nr:iron ABC transporter permease [Bacillota bacterium]